ncbi:MAG: tRNA uridine(34) 5-carboxymethylaminomethyl modification radical SAM/GNAT enzyme Elp3 [Candidatus Micrarchaeia archaeon]
MTDSGECVNNRLMAIDEILDAIIVNKDADIERLKRKVCDKYHLPIFIRNSELIQRARFRNLNIRLDVLRKRPMRTISGIANIAIMSMSDCPHGRCTYCPKGKYAPNSYTGFEPATMRGIQNMFDAGRQVRARINQLFEIGHPTDKCEIIIQGGTFLSQPQEYQDKFILDMYNALNEHPCTSIEEAIHRNESAVHRCVGLTIETRPDWCKEAHINSMLRFGTTRVEIGVQTLDQSILARTNRGHSIEDVWESTRLAKDFLLKVCYHMMPGLYSNPQRDVEMFRELFNDDKYKPDMLKIYPLLIMKGTKMYEEWKEGKIRPYSSEESAEVISEAYRYIPYYVRVMRIQRDIPAYLIEDGVKKSNLRQIVEDKIVKKGIIPQEIRYREFGLNVLKRKIDYTDLSPELMIRKYKASDGEEYFISFEDKKTGLIFAFLRLRKPSTCMRSEITENSAGIRELHVYGHMQQIGKREDGPTVVQHMGFGRRLLEEAERISRDELDCNKLLVISGVGVRGYYRKLGYTLDGPYMSKHI